MNAAARVGAITLAGVLALVLAMGWLTQQAALTRQAQMQAQRDAHLLGTLRSAAEAQLAAGLPLDVMQQTLAREQTAFPGVIAIDLFSPAGTVLSSTDFGNRGTAVAAEWRRQLAQDQPWHAESPGQRQIGQRFDNDLGQAAGGIVVTFSTLPAQPTLAHWSELGRQGLHWLALLGLAGLGAVACVAFGLRRLLRPYDDAARVLQGAAPTADPLGQAAAAQRTRWAEAQARCQQGMRQLQELDHEV